MMHLEFQVTNEFLTTMLWLWPLCSLVLIMRMFFDENRITLHTLLIALIVGPLALPLYLIDQLQDRVLFKGKRHGN